MSGQTSHDQHSHGSVRSYVIGLIASLVLTVIPFALVMTGAFSTLTTVLTIVVTAVFQIAVQLVLFMHLNAKADEGWKLASMVFTVAILILIIGGSIWIMRQLHANVMLGG
ncbi:cytochrome o ubiquinol oxidase subunit IV [Modicisalibacter radicis]|uniref:cytochrome o ubiquinol oxidase subunit IV n=1 Tax=Halomonas sp. EAR18 TaxID=2518972 RepID=UPI00109CEA09|nr:cytochrome o ubiquinol oxidase subunit IV [Halomonas sp. EAR18]